jgi:hypothetical protein
MIDKHVGTNKTYPVSNRCSAVAIMDESRKENRVRNTLKVWHNIISAMEPERVFTTPINRRNFYAGFVRL